MNWNKNTPRHLSIVKHLHLWSKEAVHGEPKHISWTIELFNPLICFRASSCRLNTVWLSAPHMYEAESSDPLYVSYGWMLNWVAWMRGAVALFNEYLFSQISSKDVKLCLQRWMFAANSTSHIVLIANMCFRIALGYHRGWDLFVWSELYF